VSLLDNIMTSTSESY